MTPFDPVLQYAQSLLLKPYTLVTTGEVYLVLWTQIETFSKVDKSWHFLWNVKHFSMFIENNLLFNLKYMDFLIQSKWKNRVV